MSQYLKKVSIWVVALCGVSGLCLLSACDQNQPPQQMNQPEEQQEQEGEPVEPQEQEGEPIEPQE